jgi:vitamin B12 transporter
MNRTSRSSVAAVAALLAASPAAAQDAQPPSALAEAIEVVARGYEASAATAVPRLTLLDEDDVERRQAATVAEMLTEVPGALVLPDGPRGQFTRLFLRGAASNQTLVLVDGIPQNDATAGGLFDFNDLGTAAVERIEVLRGSYGVLYGSEAIGGVVAVTSRRGRGPWRGFLRAEGGSFSTHREAVGVGGGDEDFDLWVTGEDEGTRGERDHERYDAQAATGRAGFRITDTLRADLVFRANESEVQSPFDFPFGTTVLPEDENIERRRDTLSTGATLTHTAGWLTSRATLSYLRVESEFVNGPDGAAAADELATANEARDVRLRIASTAAVARALGWRARRDGGVELDVTLGGEGLDQDTDTSTTFGTSTTTSVRDTDIVSGFLLAEARLPDLGPVHRAVLAGGVRRDRHDTFGHATSPYLGARFGVAPTDTTLHANWGQGFRAPKPAELDDPFSGNLALGPEESRSFDLGATQTLLDGRVELSATWFRLKTKDLIAFDPTTFQLVNVQSAQTTGWEYEARADLGGGFAVRGAFTHQNPRDADTGLALANRSRDFWSAGVAWEDGPLLVSLDAYVTSKLPDQGGEFTYPEGEERRAPGRRALVNLAARWRANEHVSVLARLENLLDDDWVATPTSPAGPPLGVFLGVRFDF